jgi:hypothetical protein
MLNVSDFPPTSTVILGGDNATLSPAMEAEVEGLWRAEERRRHVFNGRIVSAVEITPGRILGRVVEYRWFVAQQARPELFEVLRVRPVGVSGLLHCADGLVFGRRAAGLTQGAGLWELVPSGSLDVPHEAGHGARIDYRAQILAELHQEIGVAADGVSTITPYCLVEDPETHVLDIGIALTSPLSASEVLRLHGRAEAGEYDELQVVPLAEAPAFAREQGPGLVSVSEALLGRFRL